MRIVLDTNVLVSACWNPDGWEAITVRLVLDGAVVACVSEPVWAEYTDVLSRRKLASVGECANKLLEALRRKHEAVAPAFQSSDSLDPDDNRLIECAHAANADFLITGNSKHFPARCGTARVVNARQFLAGAFPELIGEQFGEH